MAAVIYDNNTKKFSVLDDEFQKHFSEVRTFAEQKSKEMANEKIKELRKEQSQEKDPNKKKNLAKKIAKWTAIAAGAAGAVAGGIHLGKQLLGNDDEEGKSSSKQEIPDEEKRLDKPVVDNEPPKVEKKTPSFKQEIPEEVKNIPTPNKEINGPLHQNMPDSAMKMDDNTRNKLKEISETNNKRNLAFDPRFAKKAYKARLDMKK